MHGSTYNNLINLSASAPNSPCVNKPDTYVKIQLLSAKLLPDKKRKYQTRIQRKTFTPLFDETFYFKDQLEQLHDKTLHLSLFELGRFSKHELIGSIRINDLNSIKDINLNEIEFVRNLATFGDVSVMLYFKIICLSLNLNFEMVGSS